MKITCGTDIIEVKRVQEAIENLGDKFIKKIYTLKEIEYCNNTNKEEIKYEHFAARFAAKEAIYKAISELLEDKSQITWTDVEILLDENKKPRVYFLNDKNLKIKQIDISLSHAKEYATAMCVVLSEEGEKE